MFLFITIKPAAAYPCSCEGQFKKMTGYAGMAQVLAAITVEQVEQQPAPVKKAA